MIIKTSRVLKSLGGKDLTDGELPLTLGHLIGSILTSSKIGGAMKVYALGERVYKAKDKVEVDAADLGLIKQALESQETGWTPLATGQALVMLSEAEQEPSKEGK